MLIGKSTERFLGRIPHKSKSRGTARSETCRREVPDCGGSYSRSIVTRHGSYTVGKLWLPVPLSSVCQVLTTRILSNDFPMRAMPLFYFHLLPYGLRVQVGCSIKCKHGCTEITNLLKKYGWAVVRVFKKCGDYQCSHKLRVGGFPSLGEISQYFERWEVVLVWA